MSRRISFAALALLLSAAPLFAQDAPSKGEPAGSDQAPPAKFVTKPGMFNILVGQGQTFFEIPDELFDRELFWYAEVVDDPPETDGILGNGVGSALVRFELGDGVVYLRDLTDRTNARAHFTQDVLDRKTGLSAQVKVNPVDMAVENANLPPVMMAFPVLGAGPNGGTVIDVTDAFTSDIDEFSLAASLLGDGLGAPLLVGPVDPHRSYIQHSNTFPENIHIRSLLTFVPPDNIGNSGLPVPQTPLSFVVGHSIALLPVSPMKARLSDDRVGYFASSFTDYDEAGEAGGRERSIILRRRLEKKDPSHAVSEPVEPIVFYIGRDFPDKWRPYVKKAVENWQPAFEAAGFKNAIVAKDAPSAEEDPDWDPYDARWSVIRWVAEPIENAQGPNIHDPRSGEILSAHVLVWADVINLAQQWYFTQAGGADKRAAKLPLSDEILGAYLTAIVGHEVGHTLGLRHNFKASQAFGVEQLRNPGFANKYGPVASIMSYGRINFVAQPGDGITEFLPKVGPYDHFAIAWGYKPIPEADSLVAELPTLNKWAEAALDNPWLAFGGEDMAAVFDPTVLTETIGKDRIESTVLGLKNLDRVVEGLKTRARHRDELDTDIEEMYGVLLDTRTGWIRDVAKMVGGQVEHRGQAMADNGPRFVAVPADEQRRAVAFIIEQGLVPPGKYLDPGLLSLFAVADATGPVEDSQAAILNSLLSGRVYTMLHQQSALDPSAYTIDELLTEVTAGVWAELGRPGTPISPLRRSLQRAYLDRLGNQLAAQGRPIDPDRILSLPVPPEAAVILLSAGQGTDFNAAVGAVMLELGQGIHESLKKMEDPGTAAHLANALGQVKTILAMSSQ